MTLACALLGLNVGVHAAPVAPAAVVTFDTTPRAGQHQRQLLDIQAVMKMRAEPGADASEAQRAKIAQGNDTMVRMGPMKMTMRMQQTLQVGQPDADGWLPLTIGNTSQGGQMEVGGKTTPLPTPKQGNLAFTARFNPKDFAFELKGTEGSPEATELMRKQGSALMTEALQLYKALSQRPMKVGDSVELPLNMAMPMALPGGNSQLQSKVRYTLARVERGVAHFDLNMDMDITTEAPMPARPASAASAAPEEAASAPAAAPLVMRMKMQGRATGNSSMRLADRLPLANTLTMDMQMTADMPDNGRMLMDMTLVMKAKGESLAKPAAKAKP
ncbi:hypothetical protein DBR42_11160 [Pelomonas sp. HMWF004]|nr:hypothetical protein DBR42_11160 [Pelomonas sp. HMWF004]